MTAQILNTAGGSQIDVLIDGIAVASIDSTGVKVGAGRRLAQRARFRTAVVASGATPMPYDDTLPQIGEGDQFMALTVTPTAIGSTMKITAFALFGMSTSGNYLTMALFRDAVADAMESSSVFQATSLGGPATPIMVCTEFVTTSLTPITFRARAGNAGGATNYINGGNAGLRYNGGANGSYLLVEEYLP